MYVNSTESSMTLSWLQSGNVDKYIIKQNNTETTHVSFTGVGSGNVSATVNMLTPGHVYCISVTAVSGHLHSDEVLLCNNTGEWLLLHCLYIAFVPVMYLRLQDFHVYSEVHGEGSHPICSL